jgi:hypothetical protein
VAQAIHELGIKAYTHFLAKAASAYENLSVRRLGCLMENFVHARQAAALRPFAEKAKSFKAIGPSAKPIGPELAKMEERNPEWKRLVNGRSRLAIDPIGLHPKLDGPRPLARYATGRTGFDYLPGNLRP